MHRGAAGSCPLPGGNGDGRGGCPWARLGPRKKGRRWRTSAGKQQSRRALRGCLEGSFQVVTERVTLAVTSLCWELTEHQPRMSGEPTEPSPRPWGAGALLVPISRRRKLRPSWSGSRPSVHSGPQASTAALSSCPGREPSGHAQFWKESGAYLTHHSSGLSDPRGREASLGVSGWSKRALEDGPRRGAPWGMGWGQGTPILGQHPHLALQNSNDQRRTLGCTDGEAKAQRRQVRVAQQVAAGWTVSLCSKPGL